MLEGVSIPRFNGLLRDAVAVEGQAAAKAQETPEQAQTRRGADRDHHAVSRAQEALDTDEFAKTIHYVDMRRYDTWVAGSKTWNRRTRGGAVQGNEEARSSSSLGRVYNVHPNSGEMFYLGILLHDTRGPTSFQALRTLQDGYMCN